MSPPDALEQIAARYREEGYQVSIRPSAADLPSFLENSEVLLYAHKGSEHLALGRPSSRVQHTGVVDRTEVSHDPSPRPSSWSRADRREGAALLRSCR